MFQCFNVRCLRPIVVEGRCWCRCVKRESSWRAQKVVNHHTTNRLNKLIYFFKWMRICFRIFFDSITLSDRLLYVVGRSALSRWHNEISRGLFVVLNFAVLQSLCDFIFTLDVCHWTVKLTINELLRVFNMCNRNINFVNFISKPHHNSCHFPTNKNAVRKLIKIYEKHRAFISSHFDFFFLFLLLRALSTLGSKSRTSRHAIWCGKFIKLNGMVIKLRQPKGDAKPHSAPLCRVF